MPDGSMESLLKSKNGQLEGHSKENRAPRPLDTEHVAWRRQPKESHQAYSGFLTYLMMPADTRSVVRAAHQAGKSETLFRRWCRRWRWVERTSAYEEHYMLLHLESAQAERELMFQKHKGITDMALDVVSAEFRRLQSLIKEAEEAQEQGAILDEKVLVRLLDAAMKLDRTTTLERVSAAESAAQTAEHLADKMSDEISAIFRGFLDDLNLPPDQRERAEEIARRHLLGGGIEESAAKVAEESAT